MSDESTLREMVLRVRRAGPLEDAHAIAEQFVEQEVAAAREALAVEAFKDAGSIYDDAYERGRRDVVAAVKAAVTRILNTVDPLGQGADVRMDCVRIVRAALEAATGATGGDLRAERAADGAEGHEGSESGREAHRALDLAHMYHGTCPKCGEWKFIGHGPLCGDCWQASDA